MVKQKPHSPEHHLQAFRAGKESGFDYFFRAYYKPLCFFASRFVKDSTVAEDLVSDNLMQVWKKRELFTTVPHFKNYCYKSLRYACLRWLHQRQNNKHKQKITVLSDALVPCLIDSIIHAEFIQHVYEAFNKLPPACRIIFNKLYVEGKSVRDTAAELGLATTTVKTQKTRGIKALRKQLLP